MPTPLGHALAGIASVWLVEAASPGEGSVPTPTEGGGAAMGAGLANARGWTTRVLVGCAVVAILPDLDILFHAHRSMSHSFGAALMAAGLAAVIASRCKWPVLRVAVMVGLAYGSHVLLDWLGKDTSVPLGVPALWPLTRTFFHSGFDAFLEVSRQVWRPDEFVLGNLHSVVTEIAILGPIAALAWIAKRRRARAMQRQWIVSARGS